MVYPKESQQSGDGKTDVKNELKIVYDHGKVPLWESFDEVRARVNKQWSSLPKSHDPISDILKEKIRSIVQERHLSETA